MEIKEFKTYFTHNNLKELGNNNFTCQCPAHEDNNNSLEVWLDDNDYIAIKCYAGCNINSILRSKNLQKKDLVTENAKRRFKEQNSNNQYQPVKKKPENNTTQNNNTKNTQNQKTQDKPKAKLNIKEEYNYCDVDGKLIFQVVRLEPKDFRMRHVDSTGKWNYSIKNIKKVLCNLPNLVSTIKNNQTVYIVEGEKDVNNINALGLTATTNVGGASSKLNDSKWLPEFNGNFFKYLMKHSRKMEVIAQELKILPGSLKTYYQFRDKQLPAHAKLAIIKHIDIEVINLLLTEYEKEKINKRNEELKKQYELEQQKQSKRDRKG